MTPFKPEVLRAIETCRSHAQDLFEGAKQLREKSLPNLSYHLATLALEELGKGQLAVFIELPVTGRGLVWRIENRPLEELIVHACTDSHRASPATAERISENLPST
jgi:hypothetical protein